MHVDDSTFSDVEKIIISSKKRKKISAKAHSLLGSLLGAYRSEDIYEINSKNGPVVGCVADIGHGNILIHRLSDSIFLDGYSIIWIKDVCGVKPHSRSHFYKKALALRHQKPRVPRGLDLSSIEMAIKSVGNVFSLISLSCEKKWPGACAIGQIFNLGSKEVMLRWITPDAKFSGFSPRFHLGDISEIVFGTDYMKALCLVAGLKIKKIKYYK
jgi:hypothetical protein